MPIEMCIWLISNSYHLSHTVQVEITNLKIAKVEAQPFGNTFDVKWGVETGSDLSYEVFLQGTSLWIIFGQICNLLFIRDVNVTANHTTGWANKKQANFKLPSFQRFFIYFLQNFSVFSILTEGDRVEKWRWLDN